MTNKLRSEIISQKENKIYPSHPQIGGRDGRGRPAPLFLYMLDAVDFILDFIVSIPERHLICQFSPIKL